MHTLLYRTNSLLTFVASVLVLLCILASITDCFHQDKAAVAVNVSASHASLLSCAEASDGTC